MGLFFHEKHEDCKHEWEINVHKDGSQDAICSVCFLECDHADSFDGFCEDCGIKLPDADEREDRAYENWREREA